MNIHLRNAKDFDDAVAMLRIAGTHRREHAERASGIHDCVIWSSQNGTWEAHWTKTRAITVTRVADGDLDGDAALATVSGHFVQTGPVEFSENRPGPIVEPPESPAVPDGGSPEGFLWTPPPEEESK